MKWINEKTVQGDPMDTKNYSLLKEERHAHWNKENEEDTLVCVYKCSLCGGEVLSEAYLFKYCPYCGCAIKMEVEE